MTSTSDTMPTKACGGLGPNGHQFDHPAPSAVVSYSLPDRPADTPDRIDRLLDTEPCRTVDHHCCTGCSAAVRSLPLAVRLTSRSPRPSAGDRGDDGWCTPEPVGCFWPGEPSPSPPPRPRPGWPRSSFRGVRPMRLLVESVLYGVAAPLTAAATGGLLGILMWFRPGKRAGEHPGVARFTLLFFGGLVAVIYSGLWVIDAVRLPNWPQLALHVLVAVIALLAVRICVQLALLHEQPDPYSGTPVLCVHCERVVPNMAFCPACAAAARASSRSSRRVRQESPPVREGGAIRGDV